MVEKKCENNLEKAERVSVRRQYTMKTLNSHMKESKLDERKLLRSVPIL